MVSCWRTLRADIARQGGEVKLNLKVKRKENESVEQQTLKQVFYASFVKVK